MPKKLTFNYEMLSPVTITEEDVKDIARLGKQLTNRDRKLTKRELIICARTSYIFVARLWQDNGRGRIVGMTSVVILHLAASGCGASIEDVIVSHKYRHRGIGTVLLQKVFDFAREKGAAEIWLDSNAKWTEAHAMYGKMGMKYNPKVKVFEASLK